MAEPKPFASLSSSLLARKGQAKPAMRPQGHMMGSLEDLGWNDMGHNVPPVPRTSTQMPTPMAPSYEPEPIDVPVPEVVRQQAAIAQEMGAEVEPVAAPVEQPEPVVAAEPMAAPMLRAQPGAKPKSAFTLRLDRDRHLKLRLACAIQHRSAQTVVTEALDAFLATMPEIETLAAGAAGTTR
jgi:hypothetical protein